MYVNNITGKEVDVFTAGRKGQRDTLDVTIPHGEDKRINGHAPLSPSVLFLHTAPDDIRNNKIQVLPGKLTIWGDKAGRRIIIRFHGEKRPLPGMY